MRVMVTGGAGFIGRNLTEALVTRGHEVVVVDNLARAGSERNLRSLVDHGIAGPLVAFRKVDVRDAAAVGAVMTEFASPFEAVVHLAGQTTVTDSITDPFEDFDVNACGTLTILEAVRKHAPSAHTIFASTNKVYGDLRSLRVERTQRRYVLPDHPDGISETFPTNPATPYGCSKLAADCYVRDYAKTYDMATTVFRMSCVYGKWQNGTLGQGWVSWFVRSALLGSELTVYGDGLQVRDLLHVDDLVEACLGVIIGRKGVGEVFNLGGGAAFSLSVWAEFGMLLEDMLGRRIPVRYDRRRLADQDVYISDCQKLSAALAWKPRRSPSEGLSELIDWMGGSVRAETTTDVRLR